MSGWVSRVQPVVDHTGEVPPMVLTALSLLGRSDGPDCTKRRLVREFLDEVCGELAEARRQVVSDRRELDRLRAWRHRLDEDAQGREVA